MNIKQSLNLIRKKVQFKSIRNEDGFTFVEIIVVLAIILILAGTVGVLAFQYIAQANVAAAKTQIQTYSMALNSYAIDNGKFPTTEQGLSALWQKPSVGSSNTNWKGPYLEKAPVNDPWGHPYQYQMPGPNNLPFGIFSYGTAGPGTGDGQSGYITSWQ